MAAQYHYVSLTEDDVPGAKLPYPLVENHSVVQLKRWLQCRDLTISGNLSDLIKRVRECIEAGNSQSICISVDGGKWYDLKLKKLKETETQHQDKPKASIPPITGWNIFPSVDLPKHFNAGHVHHHIIESVQFTGQTQNTEENDDDVQDLHTAKPLNRGRNY